MFSARQDLGLHSNKHRSHLAQAIFSLTQFVAVKTFVICLCLSLEECPHIWCACSILVSCTLVVCKHFVLRFVCVNIVRIVYAFCVANSSDIFPFQQGFFGKALSVQIST